MKWLDLLRLRLASAPKLGGAASDTSDLIPKVVIPVLVIEADNEPIPYYGEDASGDCSSPQELLEVTAFEQQMQTLGLQKIEIEGCEIQELDFSRLDRVAASFG